MAQKLTCVKDIWYFAAFRHEVTRGAMHHKTIAGHPIVLGRSADGILFALRDICPHRAAPLSAGRIIGDSVECPYHGWQFGLNDGQCVEIPSICAGQKNPKDGIKLRDYPVREDGNLIWIYISSDKKFTGTPTIDPPQFAETALKPRMVERLKLNAHVDHAVIGLMDPAHVSFLHKQWWWRTGGSMHEKTKKFEPRENGWAMASHTPSSNSLGYKLLGGKPVTEIRFQLPNIRTEHITVGKKNLLSFTAVTPIDDSHTEITQAFFTDINIVKLLSPIIGLGVRTFLHQDGDIIKLQAKCLAYDPNLMLVGDADQQAKWYFALKKEWAKSRVENREFINPVKAQNLSWRS